MMTITVPEYRKLSEAIGAAFDSGASLSDVLRTVQLIEWWAGDENTKMKQDELNKNNR